MRTERIPLVILGGSDLKPTRLPDDGADKHPLSGYKGVDVRIGGRPLIDLLLETIAASESFDTVYIAGPSEAYREIAGTAVVIDTNSTFGRNIEAGVEAVRERHPGSPLAVMTCDIVPAPDTLRALMERYYSKRPCDLWFPMITAPEDRSRLGASSWKPAYRIVPREGQEAVGVLPGHLLVADPDALRRRFMYRLIEIGYNTRNRSINSRRSAIVRGILLELLREDLSQLRSLWPPTFTLTALSTCLPGAARLREGTLDRRRLEDTLRKLFVTARHRHRHPERRVLTPLVDAIDLALDIDTEEEAREHGGEFSSRNAG